MPAKEGQTLSIVSATRSGRRRTSSLAFLQTQEATLAVFIVVLLLFLGITAPAFMEMQNLQDVLVNASLPAIAAIGMTMVIVSKEIDISIGSILAVCAILSGNLAVLGVPVPLVILITLVVGGLMGGGRIERLAQGHIDMDRARFATLSKRDSLGDHPRYKPARVWMAIVHRQRIAGADVAPIEAGLVNGLVVLLVDPLGRSVCREHEQGNALVIGFHHGGTKIDGCRA